MDMRDVNHPAGPDCIDDRTRVLVNMGGRYTLEKWYSVPDRRVSLFACRIQRLSPAKALISAPVSGEIGDWVIAQFSELGQLRGQIERKLGFGFVMSLDLDDGARRRMADKIIWLEKQKNFAVTETRRHSRIVPSNPQSTLVLPDASLVSCFVIDISGSGAAVSADTEVVIGMPLALGTVVGRVVRLLEPGFAIQFIEAIPPAELEHRTIRTAAQLIPDLRNKIVAATHVQPAKDPAPAAQSILAIAVDHK